MAPCFSKEVPAKFLSSVPYSGQRFRVPSKKVRTSSDVAGALHDLAVVAGVELVHGHEEFLVFQIHTEFPHVNQLIFFGEFAGNI